YPPLHSFPTRRSSDLASKNSSRCADGKTQTASGPLSLPRIRTPAQGARHLRRPLGRRRQPQAPPKKTRGGVCGQSFLTFYDQRRSEEHTSELQSRSDL